MRVAQRARACKGIRAGKSRIGTLAQRFARCWARGDGRTTEWTNAAMPASCVPKLITLYALSTSAFLSFHRVQPQARHRLDWKPWTRLAYPGVCESGRLRSSEPAHVIECQLSD